MALASLIFGLLSAAIFLFWIWMYTWDWNWATRGPMILGNPVEAIFSLTSYDRPSRSHDRVHLPPTEPSCKSFRSFP